MGVSKNNIDYNYFYGIKNVALNKCFMKLLKYCNKTSRAITKMFIQNKLVKLIEDKEGRQARLIDGFMYG